MDNVWYFGNLLAVLLRWTTGQHSYSGQSDAPIFGDYEAQRHWMEVTVNLKPSVWYTNSSDNDLQYWGLDYPPLTAYHSYFNGKMSVFIPVIASHSSLSIQSSAHKPFVGRTTQIERIWELSSQDVHEVHRYCSMMLSWLSPFLFQSPVLVVDLLLYFTAIYKYWSLSLRPIRKRDKAVNCIISLINPALILIDYGHFQLSYHRLVSRMIISCSNQSLQI